MQRILCNKFAISVPPESRSRICSMSNVPEISRNCVAKSLIEFPTHEKSWILLIYWSITAWKIASQIWVKNSVAPPLKLHLDISINILSSTSLFITLVVTHYLLYIIIHLKRGFRFQVTTLKLLKVVLPKLHQNPMQILSWRWYYTECILNVSVTCM